MRVDGIDTATGKHRPRQLGTYPSQRSANAAARSMKTEDRSTERGFLEMTAEHRWAVAFRLGAL